MRAFDAQSRPIGSHANREGQIFIESQAWCLLGGAGATNGRARQVLDSLHERLYTPDGIILQQPAYRHYHLELGEISSYPPGYKENAGIFCHNNTWIHLALCQLGEGDKALEYYLSICPSAKEEGIETYRAEPYVYAQMIAGRDAPTAGEAKNSWLTGTAAWTFVVVSQGILGIKPDFDGLTIDPCVPQAWESFSVTRRYQGATYHIRFHNPRRVTRGVAQLTVNGQKVTGNRIAAAAAGQQVTVDVTLG